MIRRFAAIFPLKFAALALLIAAVAGVAEAQRPRDARRAQQLVEQGNRSLNQKNFREAVEKYAEAIALNPRNANARFAKGKAHKALAQNDLALMELSAALEQGYPRPLDVYLERWRIYYDAKDLAAAQKDVDAALAIDAENVELLVAQGEMKYANKLYQPAIDAFTRALAKQPGDAEVHLSLERAYAATGNVQGQGESAQEAINRRVQNMGEAYLLLGDAMRKQKRYAEAANALQSALTMFPKNYDIYAALGEVYKAQSKYEDAIRIYRNAINTFGVDGRIYTELAWFYSIADRHEDAVEAAKAAVRLLPDKHQGYTNLCRAYNDLKRGEMALRECNNALARKPNDGETYFYLGNAYLLLNRDADATRAYKQAVAGLEQATRQEPNSSDNFYLLGNAYYSDNQPKRAVSAYLRALELAPGFGRARYNLGVLYVAENNKQAATQQYNSLMQIDQALAVKLKAMIDAMR